MLKIGEFSRLSQATVKTLHHYDEIGLLRPAQTDPFTNYRYYTLDQIPDLHMRVEMVVAEGDLVSCRVFSEGTDLGKLNGVVPPTGRRFAGWQCHWFRVADGKLAEHWATRDDLSAMLQLGIIQPPGPPH